MNPLCYPKFKHNEVIRFYGKKVKIVALRWNKEIEEFEYSITYILEKTASCMWVSEGSLKDEF